MKKILKIALALVMLAAVVAAFFGVPACAVACKVQPAPTIAFLVVLLLTPVVGRFFCETMCPLGILQTAVNWLFHPKTQVRRVCTRLPVGRGQALVRLGVLAVLVVLAVLGLGGIAWSLTPYSILGKALAGFVPGLVLAGLVLVLAAIGKGRVWCNWVCPVGTVFALLAKKSVCKHQVGKGCGNCKACFNVPRGDAAPEAGDGTGADTVPRAALGRGVDQPPTLTRRETLQGVALLAAAEAVEKTTDGGFAAVTLHSVPERPQRVLPPGAVEADLFTATCVGCQLCVKACPGDCLKPSLKLKTFGQVELDFRKGHCLSGCPQKCASVCPAGAIRRFTTVPREDIHMGHAIWRKDRCIRTTDGVACTACSRKCPVNAIHIVEGFPVVDKAACIGCGACEHVCPSRPEPAIIVKGFARQRVVVPMGTDDLYAEMDALVRGDKALVIAKNGVIVSQKEGRGIAPILNAAEAGELRGAIVADKVIGRAAAAIAIGGGAVEVRTPLAAEGAKALLESRGIRLVAEKTVPTILNREGTGSCPMEAAVKGYDEPAQMVSKIKETLERMKAK